MRVSVRVGVRVRVSVSVRVRLRVIVRPGSYKVFQQAFEYAPPQGQELCKIRVSRHCIASSAHCQTKHGCCCEDSGSLMLVFRALKITPVLLCHCYVHACAACLDKMSF